MNKKSILIFAIPLLALLNICVITFICQLSREPDDFSVLAAVICTSTLVFFNYVCFLILKHILK